MTATCTLTVTSGPAAGREIEVERELIIGRQEADLTISDHELSRRHAAVRPVETGVIVEDLGSLNGTFVDGERISGPVTLTADATIRVGTSEMSLQLALVAATPEAEKPADDSARTRLATAFPPEAGVVAGDAVPGSIPQPQVTRVRQVPDAEPQQPVATAQPQVTRVRQVPDVEPQQPVATAQPQVTRVRAVAPGEGAAQAEVPESPGGEAQARRPGAFKRLLGRILGRGKDGERADG